MMNPISLVAALALLAPNICAAGAPTAKPANAIAPGDLGVVKFVFEGAPEAGQLLVLRREKYRADQLIETYESITNTNGDPHSDPVVLIDRSFLLPESAPQLLLRAPGSSITLDGASLKKWEGGADRLTLEIETKLGPIKYVFRVFQESYKAVNARHPGLPPLSSKWSCNAFFNAHE